jgi:hypothetical protein
MSAAKVWLQTCWHISWNGLIEDKNKRMVLPDSEKAMLTWATYK